jgi:signal transduction histidine kinase
MSHARPAAIGASPEQQSLKEEVSRLRARIAELEAGAREGEDAVSTVFAMLSHELRSPLQSLLLNVSLCLERLQASPDPPPPWLIEKLEKQWRGAGRLKLLIDTFLNVGQIAAGQLQFVVQPVDLGELVGDVVRRVGDDLAWSGCELSLQAAPGVEGTWDHLQLDLVVSNLLSNAMKYGCGRPIEVAVWGTADRGFLRVVDHGPGIALADQRRIFDKFARLGAPSRISGFGLGLWIVRHIVEGFAGTVEVDSEPGRGAAFLVSLPRSFAG